MEDKRSGLKRECQRLYREVIVEKSLDEDKRNRFFEIIMELAKPAVAGQLANEGGASAEACEEIISQGCALLYIKGVIEESLTYDESRGYFADYAIGVMKMGVKEFQRKRRKKNAFEESFEAPAGNQSDEDGLGWDGILVAGGEGVEPEEDILRQEKDELLQRLMTSFLEYAVGAKTVPFQMLAMCYVKLLAMILQLPFSYNSYLWAEKVMAGRTLRELADGFIDSANGNLPYIHLEWGEPFETAMEGGFHKNGRNFECLAEVIFSDEFTKKDLENWSERVFKKLSLEWSARIGRDEELAEAVIQYVEARGLGREQEER